MRHVQQESKCCLYTGEETNLGKPGEKVRFGKGTSPSGPRKVTGLGEGTSTSPGKVRNEMGTA